MRKTEAFGLVFALLCGVLALLWPYVERRFLSGCPYLAANPGAVGTANPHGIAASPASAAPPRYVAFENGLVLMAGEHGKATASGFMIDAKTGKFVSLSSTAPSPSIVPDEIVDLGGAIVTPGFVDPHVHFLSTGLALLGRIIDVRGASNGEELQEHILSAISAQEDLHKLEWAVAYGFQEEFGDSSWLNDISTPTVVFRFDSHQLLANTKALELAGITADTEAPDGGAIIRDANGVPNGVLCDAAMGLVTKVLPPPSKELLLEAFLASEDYALRMGVTRVGDMGRVAFDDEFASFDDLQDVYIPEVSSRQRIRLDAFVNLKAHDALTDLIDTLGTVFSNGKLRIGGVKDFYDGSLSSQTALFTRPYKDGDGTNAGIRLVDRSAWEEMVRAADREGLHIATHAIGSKAVDEVLKAYEKLPNRHRHRIEHAQHVSSLETINRMAAAGIAGVTPNPQHWVYDRDVVPTRLHDEDATLSFPLSEFHKAGVNMGISSDAPVVPLDPTAALQNAMDTLNPYAVGAWEALYGITRGGHALSLSGDGDERIGFIAEGWLADFVVHRAKCDQTEQCSFENAIARLVNSRSTMGERDESAPSLAERVYIAGKQVI